MTEESELSRLILIHVGSEFFHPVYTHQLVDPESLEGSVMVDKGEATESVIAIRLSPSWRCCHISHTPPNNKKRKSGSIGTQNDTEPSENAPPADVALTQKAVQFSDSISWVDKLMEKLEPALPPIVDTNMTMVAPTQLLGSVLKTYDVASSTFTITLVTGDEACSFHNDIQNLALFFIENASNVNIGDSANGKWQVLYLWKTEKDSSIVYLTGYMTLFHFTSPFRKPTPGTVVRICQALLLPPFQRMGHGRRMLETLYNWADGNYPHLCEELSARDVVEINVEDPAPAFVALRNMVDYNRHRILDIGWFSGVVPTDPTDDVFFDQIKWRSCVAIAAKMKVTPKQVIVVYELDRLNRLEKYLLDHDVEAAQSERLQTRCRLMIKKRIRGDNKEELSGLENKDAVKRYLSARYGEAIGVYRCILKR